MSKKGNQVLNVFDNVIYRKNGHNYKAKLLNDTVQGMFDPSKKDINPCREEYPDPWNLEPLEPMKLKTAYYYREYFAKRLADQKESACKRVAHVFVNGELREAIEKAIEDSVKGMPCLNITVPVTEEAYDYSMDMFIKECQALLKPLGYNAYKVAGKGTRKLGGKLRWDVSLLVQWK